MTSEQPQSRVAELETQLAEAQADAKRARMPLPATLPELKQLLPRASREFIVKQLEARADVPTAMGRYITALEARLSTPKPVEKPVAPAPAPEPEPVEKPDFAKMSPAEQAKAEWVANINNCRSRFNHDDAFLALRTREIVDERRHAA